MSARSRLESPRDAAAGDVLRAVVARGTAPAAHGRHAAAHRDRGARWRGRRRGVGDRGLGPCRTPTRRSAAGRDRRRAGPPRARRRWPPSPDSRCARSASGIAWPPRVQLQRRTARSPRSWRATPRPASPPCGVATVFPLAMRPRAAVAIALAIASMAWLPRAALVTPAAGPREAPPPIPPAPSDAELAQAGTGARGRRRQRQHRAPDGQAATPRAERVAGARTVAAAPPRERVCAGSGVTWAAGRAAVSRHAHRGIAP